MESFEIGRLARLELGYVGETESREICIDMSDWLKRWPGAGIAVDVLKPDREEYYLAPTDVEDGILRWVVTESDVDQAGRGMAQIRMYDFETGKVYKSRTVETIIRASIDMEEDVSAPHPMDTWVARAVEAKEGAIAASNEAVASAEAAQAAAEAAEASGNEATAAAETATAEAQAAEAASGTAEEAARDAQAAVQEAETAGSTATEAAATAQEAAQAAEAASGTAEEAAEAAQTAAQAAEEYSNAAEEAATGLQDAADAAIAVSEMRGIPVTDWEQGVIASATGADGSSTTRCRSGYHRVTVGTGLRVMPNGQQYIVYTYDSDKGYLGRLSDGWVTAALQTDVDFDGYIRMCVAYTASTTITPDDVAVDVELTPAIVATVSDLGGLVEPWDTTFFAGSPNLLDKSKVTTGKYWQNTATKSSTNTSYFITDYIPVTAGETIWLSHKSRYTTALDANWNVLTDAGRGSASAASSYTVPDGVAYIVVTGYISDYDEDWMCNVGDALLEYQPYGEYTLKPEYIEGYVKDTMSEQAGQADSLAPVRSLCGGNSVIVKTDTLTSGTLLATDDFPLNLKKGVGMTFYAKFDAFTSAEFGKGYQRYRGDALRIDGTNISWVHYGDTATDGVYPEQIRAETAHGLTISGFLSVSFRVGNDFKCSYTVETMGGLFSGTFGTDSLRWSEMNSLAFCIGAQDMTEVELKAVALDIKCPVWIFGDSYFGVSGTRVIGQLNNLGYTDGCLICGKAGMASDDAYNNNLVQLIAMGGMPKYLVWCEGMNATAAVHTEYLNKLLAIRDKYGFELILYKVPTVPTRTDVNNANNAAVLATGCRYVDAYKAVGTDDTGAWYDGYLSTDGVHPTSTGAKAIAHRIVVDVPEIMQYGYSTGNVSGETTGDI